MLVYLSLIFRTKILEVRRLDPGEGVLSRLTDNMISVLFSLRSLEEFVDVSELADDDTIANFLFTSNFATWAEGGCWKAVLRHLWHLPGVLIRNWEWRNHSR